MKTLTAALVTAIVVFALASVWTEMVQPRLDSLAAGSTPHGKNVASKSSAKRTSRRTSVLDEDEETTDELITRAAMKAAKAVKSRGESALNELTKERLLAQFDDVKKKEARLIEREDTINAICAEIRRELAEIDQIRRQSAMDVAFVEQSVIETAANSRNAARQAPESMSSPAVAKQKSTAESRIASVVQDLANRGNIKDAAALLSGFKDRDITKILLSLTATNPRVALQLSDQIGASKLQASKQDTDRR